MTGDHCALFVRPSDRHLVLRSRPIELLPANSPKVVAIRIRLYGQNIKSLFVFVQLPLDGAHLWPLHYCL